MSTDKRRILVTSALPYANGPLHLGHMLEQTQTDIWVRFQRLRGHECYYVCADDAHGTAIMLSAEKQGVSPEAQIDQIRKQHLRDSEGFSISFDNFSSTHSKATKRWTEKIYAQLKSNGHIAEREITQAFDEEKGLFLADRFIKGTCPKCGSADQYGDNCETCGATYSPTELKDPVSALSGSVPVEKASKHLFFRLPLFEDLLRGWIRSGSLQEAVANKLGEWINEGLQEWDISRDAPYFGFTIPGEDNKYFYVWMDAPIGYIGSFEELCSREDIAFEPFWHSNSETELYHFIGKDIINFHGLFWPAILDSAELRAPTGVFAHGFLTVNGTKMSKSRGTFINASHYLEHLDSEYLRYYFAGKLGSGVDDIDLNLEDFVQRVNSDVVGKVVNIASRCSGFLRKGFSNKTALVPLEADLLDEFVAAGEEIAEAFEAREFARAVRSIMALADKANHFIDKEKPWVLVKDDSQQERVQAVCTTGINAFRILMIYLAPILPRMAERAGAYLQSELTWTQLKNHLLDHELATFEPLMQRIEYKKVAAMVDANKQLEAPLSNNKQRDETTKQQAANGNDGKNKKESASGSPIKIDDFTRVELRVAKVIEAELVEGADRLLKISLDVGELGTRTVFSGIRSAYEPESILGKSVVLVANLAPRKMRFGISEGMILAAGEGDEEVFLLSVDAGAAPGTLIS
ncbi:MAG: methionine--tRNA ligase [Pseudomonadota bacterium]